jgi:hypothetical protein
MLLAYKLNMNEGLGEQYDKAKESTYKLSDSVKFDII